jgi:hypothetical protein
VSYASRSLSLPFRQPLYCRRPRAAHATTAVITGLTQGFPPDDVERQVPDVASARALINERRPDVPVLLKRRRAVYHDFYGEPAHQYLERAESATLLALARMGVRHGSFGSDFHSYHNENHALEILDRRLGRVLGQEGVQALPGRDWLALSLFATCHDLRQRETVEFRHGIGNNEAASIAETHRILEVAGFQAKEHEELFVALEIMIAGSTFDASPRSPTYNVAEIVTTGGPLAPRLATELDTARPSWREEPLLERAIKLALIASDLDTANVGERFAEFAQSAARLAAEREMRAGRSLNSPESGQPVLGFLTDGQERYFFDLHRFCSDLGTAVFGQGKDYNAPRVRELADELRRRFGERAQGSFTGDEVLHAHLTLAETV